MSEKSPLSVLDFFGRGTPVWAKSRSQFGAASPHNQNAGGREEEHGAGFTHLKDHPLFSTSDQGTSQQNRKKIGRRSYSKPSIEDALDESRVCFTVLLPGNFGGGTMFDLSETIVVANFRKIVVKVRVQ